MLEKIKKPNDIKKIPAEQLPELAGEIREFLIQTMSRTGGHLASNLGVVELTIALHRVFDLPEDKMIWDVGHQSYTHKILTGRKDAFDSLRQEGGLSGFPKRSESDCDVFDTGHSSTSISAGVGYVKARELKKENYSVISIIGDGALTGGMAYEALNNAAELKTNFIIVLNDNEMSISKNVGGISTYLSGIRTAASYTELKMGVTRALERIPKIGQGMVDAVRKTKSSIKQIIIPGMFFEDMGITYLGPVDGHDIPQMIRTFQEARRFEGPILVHVLTVKGQGYEPALRHPARFHGAGPFEIETGLPATKSNATYTDIFSTVMRKMGDREPDVVAVTAAMPTGVGLKRFSNMFPGRCYDVGIAEEHAVTFAAGLALGGLIPVVAIYSSFLQRAYDEILEDVCLQQLPVIFALDRAGVVGADGETHHGIFDISYLSTAPGMTILTPASGKQLEEMLEYAASLDHPVAVRYPRGAAAVEPSIKEKFTGKNIRISCGRDVDILACGTTYADGRKAADILRDAGIDAGLVNIGIVKPGEYGFLKDDDGIRNKLYVTLEDNTLNGGFGEIFKAENDDLRVLSLGWPDKFIEHGSTAELKERYGLTPEAVAISVARALDERNG